MGGAAEGLAERTIKQQNAFEIFPHFLDSPHRDCGRANEARKRLNGPIAASAAKAASAHREAQRKSFVWTARPFSPRSKNNLRRVRGTFPLLLICVKEPDARSPTVTLGSSGT